MVGKQGRSGRKSIKDLHAQEVQYQRASFTIEFKIAVLKHFKENSIQATINRFWPELKKQSVEYESRCKQIYKWRSNSENIFNCSKKKEKIGQTEFHVFFHLVLMTNYIFG